MTTLTTVQGVGFTSVSCVAVGACTAVGTDAIVGASTLGPIVATERAGAWGPVRVLTGDGAGELWGSSCSSEGDCVAVGDDLAFDGNFGFFSPNQTVEATESAGSWGTPTEIAGIPGSGGSLSAVSCVTGSDCTAVGTIGKGDGCDPS